MSLDRALLLIGGPLVIVSGLACAVAPTTFAELAGLAPSASGATDVRAIYGGFQVGLGVFLLWCSRDPGRTAAGLVAIALVTGAIGGIRLLGMLVDQTPNAYHLANFAFEVTTVALAALAMSRVRRVAHA